MDAEAQTFALACQSATNSLYDLGSQLGKAQKLSSRAAGPALAQEMAKLGTLSTTATSAVRRATEWPVDAADARGRTQQRDLSAELERLHHRVREFQTSVSEKLRQQQRRRAAGAGSSGGAGSSAERAPLLGEPQAQYQGQQQEQVLDSLEQSQLDVHSAQVADRENEIIEIQKGTSEIHAIFQDLGILVTEQGQQLDNIEDNITELTQQTESAARQLNRAEAHQRSRGKCTLILLAVLLVITILAALNVLK